MFELIVDISCFLIKTPLLGMTIIYSVEQSMRWYNELK